VLLQQPDISQNQVQKLSLLTTLYMWQDEISEMEPEGVYFESMSKLLENLISWYKLSHSMNYTWRDNFFVWKEKGRCYNCSLTTT
jgi:hypothetical protein